MKYNPQYMIYTVVCSYLTIEERQKFMADIGLLNLNAKKTFITCVRENFDITRLNKNQRSTHDFLLHNYIEYDCKKGLPRSKCIKEFEKYFKKENYSTTIPE